MGTSWEERGRDLSPEEAARGKITDILDGTKAIHFTSIDKITGILAHGLLSQKLAEELAAPIYIEYPTKSSPDYVYYYTQTEDREENQEMLFVLGRESIGGRFIGMIASKEGLDDQCAIPVFPGSIWETQQKMHKLGIPREKIEGIIVIGKSKINPKFGIEEDLRDVISQIQRAASANPDYAVPVYDTSGNVLWPQ